MVNVRLFSELSSSDDEDLARLAAGGDPDAPLPADAVPLWSIDVAGPLLPSWYMPPPAAGLPLLRGWRRAVAWMLIATFLAIVSAGLCSTYGHLVVA